MKSANWQNAQYVLCIPKQLIFQIYTTLYVNVMLNGCLVFGNMTAANSNIVTGYMINIES